MDDDRRRTEIKARLAMAKAHLATVPRGAVAYKDALSGVRHLERLVQRGDGLPRTVNPQGLLRRP